MSREEIEELFRKMNTPPPSDPSYCMEEAGCVSGGNKIYGEAFIPLSPGKHPAVILSHGYGGTHSGFYALADRLAKAGYVAYCYDFSGGSPRSREPVCSAEGHFEITTNKNTEQWHIRNTNFPSSAGTSVVPTISLPSPPSPAALTVVQP